MLIIVEGIDRVGKTTLCNKLSNKLNIPVLKDFSFEDIPLSKEVVAEKMLTTINMIKTLKCSLIIDRFYLSELAYGIANRNYVNLKMFDIERELEKLGCILVLVRPTDLQRSINEHGSNLTVHNILFNSLYETTSLEKYVCDYNSMDKVVEVLKCKLLSEQVLQD